MSPRSVHSRSSRLLHGPQILDHAGNIINQDFYFLRKTCACGRRAGFRLHFMQLGPRDCYAIYQHLDICPRCYRLEIFSAHNNGQPIPFVHLLPVIFLPR